MSQIAAQHEATIKHHLIVRAMIVVISVIRNFRITENSEDPRAIHHLLGAHHDHFPHMGKMVTIIADSLVVMRKGAAK